MSVEQVEIKKEVFRPADILIELEEPLISFIFENKVNVVLPVLLQYNPISKRLTITKYIPPQIPKRLKNVTLDLSTARTNALVDRNIYGVTVFKLDGNVTLTLVDADGNTDSYDLTALTYPAMIYFQTYISELKVTNVAQAGKTCILALDVY
jgi:hypothetical protein